MSEDMDLPPGWTWTTLDELLIAPLANGRSVPDGDGPQVLRLHALRGRQVDLAQTKEGAWTQADAAAFLVRSGDLLVSRGNGTLSLVGRGSLVPDGEHVMAYPDTMIRIRLNTEVVDPKYGWTVWASPLVRTQIEASARTTAGIYKINQSILERIRIPLPPMPEQQRIATVIDAALDIQERLIASLKLLERRARAWEESWLESAILGVDAAAATGTSGDGLLRSIGADPVVLVDEDLPALPQGWAWGRLGEICDVSGGVTKDAKTQGGADLVEVPYLRVANVQRGSLNLQNVTHIRVTTAKLDQLRLQPGDVLMNEGGDRDKLGRGWVWEGQIDDCIHQNHVFRSRIRGQILHPRLLSWFGNTWGRRYFERHGKQTTNLASISMRSLKSLPVPVPPSGTQVLLVQEISDRLAQIARIGATIDAQRKRTASLERSLLMAAVAGRLVPQDTDDEPADQLLKRMRATRQPSGDHARLRRSPRSRAALTRANGAKETMQ